MNLLKKEVCEMKTKTIVFTKKDTAELIDFDIPEMTDNSVKIKNAVTTLSCGTERALITANPNVSPTSGPRDAKTYFPVLSGYSNSGTVLEVGKNVKNVKVGDRVALYWGHHCDINVVNSSQIVKIEDENITFSEGALSFISTFPMAALRKTGLEIGESMLIMGLGTLGLIAVKLARAAGAVPIIAVDLVKERRDAAIRAGADFAFSPTDEDFSQKIKNITHGGVKCAIEVTGVGKGLDETLDCMAKFGRVALLGCTRDSNFTIDYYRKVHAPGITLVGAHTLARPDVESHHGYFTHIDDMKAVLSLMSMGRVNLAELVRETYSPTQCTEVYARLVSDKNFPTVVQFDWSKI